MSNIAERINRLEKFINNKSIIQEIFDGLKPTYNYVFGNPHNLTTDDINFIRDASLKENYNPSPITKPYNPKKATLDKLKDDGSLVEGALRMHLRSVSPFPNHNNTIVPVRRNSPPFKARKLLSRFYPFNNEQMRRMTPELKEEVISTSLNTIKKFMRKNKEYFFNKGFMFEDQYETDKLKYLIENGEEPIVISNEDYFFLERSYIKAMRELFEIIFQEAYKLKKGNMNDSEKDGEEFYHFQLECAKRFNYLNRNIIQSLSGSFVTHLLYDSELNEKIINEYHSLRLCPLTEHLKDGKLNYPSHHWQSDIDEFSAIEPNRLLRTLKIENFLFIAEEVFSYINIILGKKESISNTFTNEFINNLTESYDVKYDQKSTLQKYFQRLHFMMEELKKYN